ncbi:unnamed protein product [Effrenium voratum]|uniref:Uncharacterized protein n=1 Tax=Effrenium voratum TaxID=2562239 RepID=A0AA36MY76_9DINO|nr:unnamed protein product [Effrenium voratum]
MDLPVVVVEEEPLKPRKGRRWQGLLQRCPELLNQVVALLPWLLCLAALGPWLPEAQAGLLSALLATSLVFSSNMGGLDLKPLLLALISWPGPSDRWCRAVLKDQELCIDAALGGFSVGPSSGPARSGVKSWVPLFPCLCVALAMALLAMTLLGSQLPEDEAFVNSGTPSTRGGNVAMQGRKFTAADRGTPEYEEYFRKKKEVKKAAWERMTTANGYRDAGVDIPGLSAPAPAPSAPAPSPMSSGGGESGGGNPFQFIIDLFNPTTTTTTTTPPPNPIEAFFKGLR